MLPVLQLDMSADMHGLLGLSGKGVLVCLVLLLRRLSSAPGARVCLVLSMPLLNEFDACNWVCLVLLLRRLSSAPGMH